MSKYAKRFVAWTFFLFGLIVLGVDLWDLSLTGLSAGVGIGLTVFGALLINPEEWSIIFNTMVAGVKQLLPWNKS